MFGELVCRGANVAENGSQRKPFFMDLRKSVQFGGLEPAGRICLHVSSVREDFLSSSVVFRSIESV